MICSTIWHDILLTLGSSESLDVPKQMQILAVLLTAHESGTLQSWLRPAGGELDVMASQLLHRVLSSDIDGSQLPILTRLLRFHCKQAHYPTTAFF